MRMGNLEKKCYTLKSINVDTGIMRLANTHDLNLLHCFCINVEDTYRKTIKLIMEIKRHMS